MTTVIVSKDRPWSVKRGTFRILKSALVSVADDEAEAYQSEGVPKKQLLVHPTDLFGLCKKRNWILKNVEDECIVMFDDDCWGISAMVGVGYRVINDEQSVMTIMSNLELGARAIGTGFFTINQYYDIRKCKPDDPFGFVGYPAGVHGIIGREIWYDEANAVHDDVDFALQALRRWRVIWIDRRFSYVQRAQSTKMVGGCQSITTAKMDRDERLYLKEKWGDHYRSGYWQLGGDYKTSIHVKRRQPGLITPERI